MLDGKTILITGASDGIGKQIALRLAGEHAAVLLMGRDEIRLAEVARQAKEMGATKTSYYTCDLRDNAQIVKVARTISDEYPIIDGLINDAGIWQKMNKLENISDSIITDVLRTNLEGLIFLTKYLMSSVKQSKAGAIINVVSRSGYVAQEGQSVYTASKYGVKGFTEVLRNDLKETSVRVAAIYQGGTNTNMFRKVGEQIPEDKYPLFIPPEGIADVVAYLLNLPNNVWLPEIKIETK